MADKRKNKRRSCLVPVDGNVAGPFGESQTVDFSRDGMGFISNRMVSVNQQIPIQLELADRDDSVLVIGKVKWVRRLKNSENYHFGVAFENVVNGTESRLARHFK